LQNPAGNGGVFYFSQWKEKTIALSIKAFLIVFLCFQIEPKNNETKVNHIHPVLWHLPFASDDPAGP
jgi:hypothetical protein